MKKFFSQKGVSLVQTLMGAAVVGGLALVLARVGLISTKIQQSALNSGEVNQIVSMVQKFMLNNRACTETLQTANFIGGNTGVITEGGTRSLNAIYDFAEPSPNPFFVVDDGSLGWRYIITDIQIRRGDSTAPDPLHDFPPNVVKMDVTFTLKNDGQDANGQARKRQSFGASEIKKEITINANFDATNVVTQCYSALDNVVDAALTEVCEQFHGGTFNTGTRACDGASGITLSATFNCNGNAGDCMSRSPWDYCALTRAGGEDGWKSSTYHNCSVRMTAPQTWVLASNLEEGRTNYCSMICFRF